MSGHWWAHKDAARVLARLNTFKPLTDGEATHLRGMTMLLLTGPLELDPDDARQLRQWLARLEGREWRRTS
jgi:hypothetical protein